jgi:hypothetical protein
MKSVRLLAFGFFGGIAISCASLALAQVRASVDTNGVLVGYTVQRDGKIICENPIAYIQFRGPQSYIVCEYQQAHFVALAQRRKMRALAIGYSALCRHLALR